jgi:hypothetical protein
VRRRGKRDLRRKHVPDAAAHQGVRAIRSGGERVAACQAHPQGAVEHDDGDTRQLFERPHGEPIVVRRLADPDAEALLVLWLPHANPSEYQSIPVVTLTRPPQARHPRIPGFVSGAYRQISYG